MKEALTEPTPTPPEGRGRARSLLERARTVCLVVIAVVLVGWMLHELAGIFTPLLIALFLFFLIRPLAESIVAKNVPRWVAYPLLGILAGLVVALFGMLLYANALEFQVRLPEYTRQVRQWAEAVEGLMGHLDAVQRAELERATVEDFTSASKWLLRASVETALAFVESSVMVVFYLFFLFLEGHRLPRRLLRAYPPETAERLLHIGKNVDQGIKRYLVLKTVISLGLGATTGLLAYLFGLDFWPLWAVLMLLANYITYVGSIVGLVPPVVLAFLQFHSPAAAAVLAALLLINRTLWIDLIELRYLGKHLNISPLLLLLALALFYSQLGVVGMVLAVPLVTATKIVLANFERTRHLAVLLSEE